MLEKLKKTTLYILFYILQTQFIMKQCEFNKNFKENINWTDTDRKNVLDARNKNVRLMAMRNLCTGCG